MPERKAAASHPGMAVFLDVLLLLHLLPFLFLGVVTAIEAAGGSAEQTVMAGIVTGGTANRRAFQAALGLGATGRKRQRRDSE
jgi:hypothetical protein